MVFTVHTPPSTLSEVPVGLQLWLKVEFQQKRVLWVNDGAPFKACCQPHLCLKCLGLLILYLQISEKAISVITPALYSLISCSLYCDVYLIPVYVIGFEKEGTGVSLHEFPFGGFPLER